MFYLSPQWHEVYHFNWTLVEQTVSWSQLNAPNFSMANMCLLPNKYSSYLFLFLIHLNLIDTIVESDIKGQSDAVNRQRWDTDRDREWINQSCCNTSTIYVIKTVFTFILCLFCRYVKWINGPIMYILGCWWNFCLMYLPIAIHQVVSIFDQSLSLFSW